MDNNQILVVLDAGIPVLENNKIFIREEAAKVMHTILPICFLYERAKEQGINFVTPDVFYKMEKKPNQVFMMSHGVTADTFKLIGLGAKPLILFSQESPYVASRFYVFLRKYSRLFKYSFLFAGAKKQVSGKTEFHEMNFPQSPAPQVKSVPFGQKKFLVFIVGAKYNKTHFKNILLKLLYGLSVKEINDLRRRVIAFFCKKPGFDLYGRGWDKAQIPGITKEDIQNSYRGSLPYGETAKMEKLAEYKFVICFENAVFPGYVTEKIFDALVSGAVPIYMGAPDVEKFVPKNAFVDFRDFKDLSALYEFLSSMPENRYNEYLKNISDYLKSDKYRIFSQETFAKDILRIIEKEKR